jgi:hypothetical protein
VLRKNNSLFIFSEPPDNEPEIQHIMEEENVISEDSEKSDTSASWSKDATLLQSVR